MISRISAIITTLGVMCYAAAMPAQAAQEEFILDPSHTSIVWSANHFGFSNPNGKFATVEGMLTLDEAKPENSKVSVTITTGSTLSGVPKLDEHMKTADFFDTAKFPTATFVSNKVDVTGKDTAKVHGDLTLRGVTKPVVLDVKLNKIGEHPMSKKKTVGFSASTVVKRSDFGMAFGIPAVSDEVKIAIETEANAK